ncbi:CRISPR-associated endonuclease/helicase Cas3 [Aequitasia blattaphilus]|uniref:CRISPR-associated helicase Cas3 n=1 Tax=Aequitasia blattaphilus TaxID=2949332 RepID=A0ABT1E878_9FIRM|nr:CRISPR-associated helicase Cas3' [Aequitasia blattaphilus]MCP1102031.1 CRISPR-associated helicase Cas3' [Aequitasia blattaphilus]MCR8614671.1 CRISPR-associated helicase Cas3' [Aequitasia blattaphilus]
MADKNEFIARFVIDEHDNNKTIIIQPLRNHLVEVATLAGSFGRRVSVEKFMYLAGLLHDMGKFSEEFSIYIKGKLQEREIERDSEKGSDHGVYGAKFIFEKYGKNEGYEKITAELLATICCYHHGKIPDCLNVNGKVSILERMKKVNAEEFERVVKQFTDTIDEDIERLFKEATQEIIKKIQDIATLQKDGFIYNLLIKLLYSMLIDADRLDSMCFEINDCAWKQYVQNGECKKALKNYQQNLEIYVKQLSNNKTKVNNIRTVISDECLYKGKGFTGVYSLTVPTGGGKTLASIRFALEHALRNDKERIIYVMPYTSIIEQNAEVFRKALGNECDLLEHHSNVIDEDKQDNYSELIIRWENDLVVTTVVQFLNSFYGRSSQDMRRIHAMANSIIVFDEVQTIPIYCMNLFRRAICFLSEILNTTVVLCTATQPGNDSPYLQEMSKNDIVEIMGDVQEKFTSLKRVDVVNKCRVKPYTLEETVDFILEKKQTVNNLLVVVNKVNSAKKIFAEIKLKIAQSTKVFYLSSSLSPEHKKDILEKVKEGLGKKEALICISTTVIEAGIDISFEAGIRNITKLDSIAQTAGRINRNGEKELGYCYVINYEEGSYSKLQEISIGGIKSIDILERFEDTLMPEAMQEYFKNYYSDGEIYQKFDYPTKAANIYKLLDMSSASNREGYRADEENPSFPMCFPIQFASASKEFEVIDSSTKSIIVPYKDGQNLITQITEGNLYMSLEEKKKLLSKAKRYTVNLYTYAFEMLNEVGAILFYESMGVYVLSNGYYDDELGVIYEASADNYIC